MMPKILLEYYEPEEFPDEDIEFHKYSFMSPELLFLTMDEEQSECMYVRLEGIRKMTIRMPKVPDTDAMKLLKSRLNDTKRKMN